MGQHQSHRAGPPPPPRVVMVPLGILLSTAALASAQHQPPVGAAVRHGTNADVDASSRPTARAGINASYSNPILAGNWPDPGALRINGSYFVATTGGGFAIHRSDDSLASWALAGSVFDPEGGGGGAPTWASGDFWAPEIHQMVGGGYCVYFTARDKAGLLSIGVAIGPTPLGPFTDSGQPLARDDEGHGMYLDAHYFHDAATATAYLVWKHGSVTPPAETRTWLYMQPLNPSGTKLVGQRRIVLRNNLSSWEKGVVEAPWIVKPSAGSPFYYLFYSAAHCCDGSGTCE